MGSYAKRISHSLSEPDYGIILHKPKHPDEHSRALAFSVFPFNSLSGLREKATQLYGDLGPITQKEIVALLSLSSDA